MKQVRAFMQSEGAAWLERNESKLPPVIDPVIEAIKSADISPHHTDVIEVGCANGWRLERMKRLYNTRGIGVDPAAPRNVPHLFQGGADSLPAATDEYDFVIYGFCLYLVDREDLFKVAAEGDRVLRNFGHIVIYDFLPDYPHKVPYKHLDGLFSYKMDYANLWLGSPAYSVVHRQLWPEQGEAVTILQKDINRGWPLDE